MIKKLTIISALIFLTNISFASTSNIENLPVEITENFENPKILGSHSLKLYFFNIYKIKTYTENNLTNKNYRQKFAITINYDRNFSKEKLIESSISEMIRIDNITKKESGIYRKYFEILFSNVKKGDIKTAFIDQNGLKLFFNNNLVGAVKDRKFALSFANIWLSKKAKYQNMRNDLLAYE